MNPYDQQSLARQVADLLRKPGGRDLFRRETERFRDWNVQWETDNADYLQRYQDLETEIAQTVNKTGPGIARKRSKLKRRRDGLRPRDPNPSPWERLLAIPQYSECEHTTKMLEFFLPAEAMPSSKAAEAACLQVGRLAILHDSVLCRDGAHQSITGGILDPDDVAPVWESMTGSWPSWAPVIDNALKDVSVYLSEPKLPDPKAPPKIASQAYLVYTNMGISQSDVANKLAQQYKRPISQGQVSKWVSQVIAWRKATGLPVTVPGKKPTVHTVDPTVIDMGSRTDGRTSHKHRSDIED